MSKKINLGCGPVGKEDWINIDWGILAFLHRYRIIEKILISLKLFPAGYNIEWPKSLRLHNCKRRLPFQEGTVDYIYTSHFLEHFRKYDAVTMLNDCYRILKNGGVIRVSVPDLNLLARKYIEGDMEFFKEIRSLMDFNKKADIGQDIVLAEGLLDNLYPGYYKKKPQGIARFLIPFIRPHRWMYDEWSLAIMLREAGFRDIKKKAFREGEVPDLDYLDNFQKMTLYMEARR